MRKIKIVADTSCDLFNLKHTKFACAPMKVITAEREFIDDEDLDVDGMVDFMYDYKRLMQLLRRKGQSARRL